MDQKVTGGTDHNVQTAVDLAGAGEEVILGGQFSFGIGSVKVTKAVTIKGDTNNIPTITGGGGVAAGKPYGAFDVSAKGQRVTIQDLHFASPRVLAIRILQVTDLLITRCKIKAVTPMLVGSSPVAGAIGIPASIDILGTLSIVDNDEIDIGGGSSDRTFGIQIIGPTGPVQLTIARNAVRNTSAHGIVLRDITGPTNIDRNYIETGSTGGRPPNVLPAFVDGIMCQGSGQYVITNNKIDCGYENATGIRLWGSSATVNSNRIILKESVAVEWSKSFRQPDFRDRSENAGIELRGHCTGGRVSRNEIMGGGRAALCLISDGSGLPDDNEFHGNDHGRFTSLIADIAVYPEVSRTVIEGGPGTIIDAAMTGQTTIVGSYTKLDPGLLGPTDF